MLSPYASLDLAGGFLLSLFAILCLRSYPLLGRDHPSLERKEQEHAIPLVGGLALGIPLLLLGLGDLAYWTGLLLALTLGILDDCLREGLAWKEKLLVQLLAGAPLCFPVLLWPFSAETGLEGQWLLIPWLILSMNAWNFFDNSDGCAAAVALAVLFGMTWSGPGPEFPMLAGALCAFLFFNWPRAQVYLGDSGSHLLGFAFGYASFVAMTEVREPTALSSLGIALAFQALPLLDLLHVVLVRLWLRRPPWVGDRRHLAHRLRAVIPGALIAPLFFFLQILCTLWLARP